jgi:hypothetical protein
MLDPELVKAFELIEEFDRNRPKIIKEFRLYYNDSGEIIGLWESNHPSGDNYIVVDNPEIFNRTNTSLLRVTGGKLIVLDNRTVEKFRLEKSTVGQPVVRGHAAIALYSNTEYVDVDFYNFK